MFLQVVVVLVALGAAALMLWEPHVEGRNAHATTFQIYFNDPFLAYAYVASIALFVALYQAFRLLGYAGQGRMFTPVAVRALRIIRYCALALIVFIGAEEVYAFVVVRGRDDIAGGVALGLVMMFLCVVAAAAAAVFERVLQTAVDMKSENDLTV
ncbi:DUF2975 family protein [Pseudonocardia endophytica]|uniref:DUF2975 family protein n=1 Tax=Pseudonocardia endophytica TaxID=401976 RepID=A0A4R1HTC7_PSEEN|nr:DUF2975 family protein [Pseudonocardia endophytica]